MKRELMFIIALVASSVAFGQKSTEFHLEQSRTIEPIHQVLVRPLVADLKILKTEMVTYPVSWQLQTKKITDISEIDLDNAIKSALHKAALSDGADILVASTYEVRNHIEKDKKGNSLMTEMGIDIIVSGYPAKYENWRKFNEKEDLQWATVLIDAQRVYSNEDKTVAVDKNY